MQHVPRICVRTLLRRVLLYGDHAAFLIHVCVTSRSLSVHKRLADTEPSAHLFNVEVVCHPSLNRAGSGLGEVVVLEVVVMIVITDVASELDGVRSVLVRDICLAF